MKLASDLKWPLPMALAIVALTLAVSPSWGQQLEPVKGPMALVAPGPFYEATMRGPVYAIKSDFVRVKSWTYTDGETLMGKCEHATASSAAATPDDSTGSNPPQLAMANVWDLIDGPGYYAAHVQGNKIVRGVFKGGKGTVLQVESLDNYFAVGEDNRGNVYKIVW